MTTRRYSRFWNKGKKYHDSLPYWGFALSILARFFPRKPGLEIFGSFNGAAIGDNALYLYRHKHARHENVFFITKNLRLTRVKIENADYPVWAFSPRGLCLQLRASKAHYTHSIFDYISPLLVGARIVCLQHGYPVKRGGAEIVDDGFRAQLQRRRMGDIAPWTYYYFCHEVWTPDGPFEENTRRVFALSSPDVIVTAPPRLWNLKHSPRPNQVLFAPTYFSTIPITERLQRWGITDSNSPLASILRDHSLQLIFRPHPVDIEFMPMLNLPSNVRLETSLQGSSSFVESAAVVTDASSIGFDAIQLGIPTYFLQPDLAYFNREEVGIFENVLEQMLTRSVTSIEEAIQRFLSLTR